MVRDEFSIFILRGILRRAHEEHVLQKVRSTVQWLFVQGATNVYVKGCTAFVCFLVMNQDAAQLVT